MRHVWQGMALEGLRCLPLDHLHEVPTYPPLAASVPKACHAGHFVIAGQVPAVLTCKEFASIGEGRLGTGLLITCLTDDSAMPRGLPFADRQVSSVSPSASLKKCIFGLPRRPCFSRSVPWRNAIAVMSVNTNFDLTFLTYGRTAIAAFCKVPGREWSQGKNESCTFRRAVSSSSALRRDMALVWLPSGWGVAAALPPRLTSGFMRLAASGRCRLAAACSVSP